MKVPNFLPPNEVDQPGLPEEAYTAMRILSDQVDVLTTALQKNISPEDNENTEPRTIDLQSGREYEISLQEIKGRPREVRVLDHALFERADLSWEVVDNEKIKVKVDWPSGPMDAVNTTLLIRGSS